MVGMLAYTCAVYHGVCLDGLLADEMMMHVCVNEHNSKPCDRQHQARLVELSEQLVNRLMLHVHVFLHLLGSWCMSVVFK